MTDHGTIHAIVLQQKHWSIVRQTQRRGEAKLADYESVRGGDGDQPPDRRVIGGHERCSSIREEKGSIESVRFYAQFPPAILSFLVEIKATVKLD